MELTDQQYEQVLRYVEREMDAAESKAFENVLIQNKTLQHEVEFYKKLHSVAGSLEQKTGIAKDRGKDKADEDEVLHKIKKARANWESRQENERRQNVVLRGEEKSICNQDSGETIDSKSEPVMVSEKAVHQPVNGEGKIKSMYRPGMVAAILICIVCLGGLFFYLQNSRRVPEIASGKKEINSKPAAKNENPEVRNNTNHNGSAGYSSAPVNRRDAVSASEDNTTRQKTTKTQQQEHNRLIANYFKPDELPPQIPAPLEDPSTYYKDLKTEDALAGYQEVLADIKEAENSGHIARGEDDDIELISFYAHYYSAQCYMSGNSYIKAIQELEDAIKIAPDTLWRNKAQWYLALAYLKSARVQKAKALLKEVANAEQSKDYKQRAVKLLNELKKD